MRFIQTNSNKSPVRSLKVICLLAMWVWLGIPANLLGESLARTIFLEANDSNQTIRIPVGSMVTFQNNYPQELYRTSVIKGLSDKALLSIQSFPAGQSFGLEFMIKGPYSICYSLKPKADSANSICLQINVVPLQTA